jgi:hypothetical protein
MMLNEKHAICIINEDNFTYYNDSVGSIDLIGKIKIISLALLMIALVSGLSLVNAELSEMDNEIPPITLDVDAPRIKGMVSRVNSAMITMDKLHDAYDKIVEETGLERLTPEIKVALSYNRALDRLESVGANLIQATSGTSSEMIVSSNVRYITSQYRQNKPRAGLSELDK